VSVYVKGAKTLTFENLCQELKTETFASKVAALASKVAVAAGGAAAGESDDEEEERYTYKHIILLHMYVCHSYICI
jgi:hypothetical protein